jgi:hypothetical protein
MRQKRDAVRGRHVFRQLAKRQLAKRACSKFAYPFGWYWRWMASSPDEMNDDCSRQETDDPALRRPPEVLQGRKMGAETNAPARNWLSNHANRTGQ